MVQTAPETKTKSLNIAELKHLLKNQREEIESLKAIIAGPVLSEEEKERQAHRNSTIKQLGPLFKAQWETHKRVMQHAKDQEMIAVLNSSRHKLWVKANYKYSDDGLDARLSPEQRIKHRASVARAKSEVEPAAKKLVAVDAEIADIRKLMRSYPIEIKTLSDLEQRAKRAFAGV